MANVIFGRYKPSVSPFHKLDSRNKLFLTILLVVMVFLKFNNWGTTIVFSIFYLILFVLLMILSKVSILELFSSLKGMWFLIIFLFAIYIFIPNTTYTMDVAFTIGSLEVRYDAFYFSGYIILRLIFMLSIMMILTTTTKPMELTHAFEWYMYPLRSIHFPVSETSMTLSIALRFIPTILEETERIMKAQSSRGVDFTHGGLFKRFKAITSLIIPLFISAIKHSDELANAMMARGYDPKEKRTKYRKLSFHLIDLIFFLTILAIFAFVLTCFIYDQSVQTIDLFQMWFGFSIK